MKNFLCKTLLLVAMLLAINSHFIIAQNVKIGIGEKLFVAPCTQTLFMSMEDQHSTMEYLIPKSILQTILQFDSGSVVQSLSVLMGNHGGVYMIPKGTFTLSMQNVN